MTTHVRFPSPYDTPAPAGAEGWESLFPYYVRFQKEQQSYEDGRFWFCNAQHWPTPFKAFDAIQVEFACKCLGQYNTRHLMVPPANGIDYRIHNGYLYMHPVAVAPELIAARVPLFLDRAGHYFQNWASLLENWHVKVRKATAEMEALSFSPLPAEVPREWVIEGRGLDNTTELLENYDRAIQLNYRAWQYHFEFLNLGYAAYLDFFTFMKEQFPDMPDQAIARMVQGIDSELFRPDDEIKKLARLAISLDVDEALATGSVDEALAAIGARPNGEAWLKAWREAQDPWFNFTSGNGFYSSDKYWREHLEIPFSYLRDYTARAKRGEAIERPTAAIAAERDRVTQEYAELMSDNARVIFDQKIGLARTVFPYVEDHNFYIEHWFMGAFWRKMRELSRMLMNQGFWKNPDDMFFLSRNEVRDALFDYSSAWAVGGRPTGPRHWPQEIERRRRIHEALCSAPPQQAFNEPPEVITEPFTIMLFGITTKQVKSWLKGADNASSLSGVGASPGIAEGLARVIRSADELDSVQEGEILVAPVTAPSWAPVFGKIRAAVTDIGGMMSHAAIVCREYGLPAVTATGSGSKTVKTGQRLRVDGSTGEVTILS